ncbi:hypothetical protein PWT90_07779 [Aphanocladium album]|nr:hypothetical protein PWT90_07779 [Aphanocladium album]
MALPGVDPSAGILGTRVPSATPTYALTLALLLIQPNANKRFLQCQVLKYSGGVCGGPLNIVCKCQL